MAKNILKVPNVAGSLVRKVKFPEKFKGTIIEKWADYWKNLFIDYRQMLQDLRTDIQDDPVKAMKYTASIMALIGLYKNNPNEIDFRHELKRISNEVVMVSSECLNEKAADHLRYLDTCYNQGVIHYRSLGIASIMYTSELNDSCDLYKAHCSYVQPSYFSFPSRIVDVGLMGKWWNLYKKTTNYDVNL
ncbi:mitochondrial import inner membrane translocase subunit Tim29 [Anticarsia gemmatalis]|uniref:mitochondrial import inner membrane translocase subunit Tim29 n=1 Tax=Anticarsia gemmatalis TaxID=129554 RepID=UPI003F75A82E